MATTRRRQFQKGVSLFVGTLSLVVIIPAGGLAVDVGMLYVTKARLQGAVDGAALAAARALNLGDSLTDQEGSAKTNAVNWFYANFPNGNWATGAANMDRSDARVHVYPDATYPSLEHVDVNVSTTAPTYFMKWFGFGATTVTATGNASRRDVVIMIVLDRSSSMSSQACTDLKNAALLFAGQFAAQRDRIGLVSFSDGTYVHQSPTTDFRAQLGYISGNTTHAGSGNHAISSVTCSGATSSAQALSVAYNELYKINLAGAFNMILFESDGLPNTLAFDWNGSLVSTSTCRDTGNHTYSAGWHSDEIPHWSNGFTMGPSGYMSDIPAGAIGSMYAQDPGGTNVFTFLYNPFHPDGSGTVPLTSTILSGCNSTDFNGSGTSTTVNSPADVATTLPATDIWGNQLAPGSHPYQTVNTTSGRVNFSGTQTVKWTNYHNAALNATDNAAHRIRSNATLPATIYVIGLDGSAGSPPDKTLMQRIANDPGGDSFNVSVANPTGLYSPCASTANCYIWPSPEPEGRFIYSTDRTKLAGAFGEVASQILRLSQ